MPEPPVEDDCPLCLEPLPPFWDQTRLIVSTCCGKVTCKTCRDKEMAFLRDANLNGSFGREEEQLNNFCPMCRSRNPAYHSPYEMMAEKFEKGQLPLNLYKELGCCYLNGAQGVETNVENGVDILLLGAEKGDPKCQFVLGEGYRKGDYVPKSSVDAKRWLLTATEQGHAVAEARLAHLFRNEGNDDKFVRYLRGSAEKGYDDACHDLGVTYYNGDHGLPKSMEDAIRVLTPAAERGDVQSMGLLARIWFGDVHFPRGNPNFSKALYWTRRAADGGDSHTQKFLRPIEQLASITCFRCNKLSTSGEAFLRCSRCRSAWYCSKDCQVQHWKEAVGGHKQCCIKWKSDAKQS